MDIKYYYEETQLTLQNIADRLNLPFSVVFKYVKKNYTKEHRKTRKVKCYQNSKLGNKNPMFGKYAEAHHNFVGTVSDNKGYWMQLKPEWYTGRKHSKHVFVHHVVVCENLGITELPKGWNVHHCDFDASNNHFDNLVLMTMSDHMRLHHHLKSATTMSKDSTLKWVEAHGTPWRRDDIVCSTQECVAASNVADNA